MPELLALFPSMIENGVERINRSLAVRDKNIGQEGLELVSSLSGLLSEYKNILRLKGIELEEIEFLSSPHMQLMQSLAELEKYFKSLAGGEPSDISSESARILGTRMETQYMLLKELSLKIDRNIC